MKTKYVVVGILVLLAAALWAGRTAWRVHRQRVTLNVRNAPLPEVLRSIEKQTWKKLRAERALADVRVTLRLTDQPLSAVLDRLAAQAGARWTTRYAVYGSTTALNALESSLRGDGNLEPAGWTKIAPQPEALNDLGMRGPDAGDMPVPSGPGQRRVMVVRRGPKGPVTYLGGPGVRVETWSPEEVLMQSSLVSRLAGNPSITNSPPSAATAAQLAKMADGKWTTYLAFTRSSLGLGLEGPPPPLESTSATGTPKDGGSPVFNVRGPNPNVRFDTLTPQQRVQRARERAQLNTYGK